MTRATNTCAVAATSGVPDARMCTLVASATLTRLPWYDMVQQSGCAVVVLIRRRSK